MKTKSFLTATCLGVCIACSGGAVGQAQPENVEGQENSASGTTQPTTAPSSSEGGMEQATSVEGSQELDRQIAQSLAAQELGVLGHKGEGHYTTGVLSVETNIEAAVPFKLTRSMPGYLVLESQRSSYAAFEAVAFIETEVLIVTDDHGSVTARVPMTSDLNAWLDGLGHSVLVDQGVGEIGGLPASWWTITTQTECESCFYELFHVDAGGWWTASGSTHKIWVVDVEGSVVVIDVEARTEHFQEWDRIATRSLLDGIVFGPESEVSSQRLELQGPHQISRLELSLVDRSRATNEVAVPNQQFTGTRVVVPASQDRTLPVSVVYPSDRRDYGADPLPGPFPLVVVAHSLGGFGLVNSLDELLASHGYVVARIRFPESSLPGESYQFVSDQPGDVSFVISELLGGALPSSFDPVLGEQPIGAIGYSLGGTTIYGLVGAPCYADVRVSAVIAHAGTLYDFGSHVSLEHAALLLVGSENDEMLSNTDLLRVSEMLGESGELLLFSTGSHLEWLDPSSSNYIDSFEATLRFFQENLYGR